MSLGNRLYHKRVIYTVLNLIQRMKKKNFDFEKCVIICMVKVVNCSYIDVMRICEKLISYIKLDHTFHWNKYSNKNKLYS